MKEICFETISSTNIYLKENYANLDNFTIVSSKTQTKGRGRNDRTWYSNDNNLLFSLLIRDKNYLTKFKAISIVSAYSVLSVLKEYGIDNLSIKWPNDVYIDDKKVCGILLESVSKQELECLIVGIGINVNQTIFNEDYLVKPTSIKLATHKDIDLNEFKNKIYERLIDNIKLIDTKDFYEEICKYDFLKGKEVYACINNKKELVKVLGINNDYSLKVILNDEILNVETGEISFHI